MGLYFHHPACLEHDPRAHMPEHPDTPERLEAIERALAAEDWLGWERREAPPAERGSAGADPQRRACSSRIRELSMAGGGAIDADTFVGEPSYRAALHAAGGACEMTRALMAGEATLGFCGVRPSGHHAEAGSCDGLLPVQQRRDRGGVRDPRAGRPARVHPRLGCPPRQRHGRGLPPPLATCCSRASTSPGIYPGTGALSDVGLGRR